MVYLDIECLPPMIYLALAKRCRQEIELCQRRYQLGFPIGQVIVVHVPFPRIRAVLENNHALRREYDPHLGHFAWIQLQIRRYLQRMRRIMDICRAGPLVMLYKSPDPKRSRVGIRTYSTAQIPPSQSVSRAANTSWLDAMLST